ncbi:MAG TPA: mycothione reductase [Segeticoccus sp.]|nr:mycothione reductase [Segeticoccus sp.]
MAEHFDLAIIGSGSGNSLVTPDFADKRVAVIEHGIFGGTCLNVGCIPTKMYVYAADVADTIRHASRYGIDATLDKVRWTDIRDRIFGRIDPISEGGKRYRIDEPNTEAFLGHATFTGPKQLHVDLDDGGTAEITADQVVLAAGSHATVPDVVADSGVPFHTSDTVMRIDDLPEHLVILGGGFISAEFAHVFSALGCEVTVINRSPMLLRHLDGTISRAFTELAKDTWDVHLNAQVHKVSGDASEVRVDLSDGTQVTGDLLLVATGRDPSTAGWLDESGVDLHPDGRVKVDEFGRTSAEGVWALGDVSSEFQLKHVANAEARCVAHNLVHPEDLHAPDERFVPSAVFTHPQIATVGATEEELAAGGRTFATYVQKFGDTAYGWAMEDRTGICKVIADPDTKLLLGAHIMGPQASNLIQPLVQALTHGQTVDDIARGQFWIHPALAEVVENALLGLDLNPPEDITDMPVEEI